MTHDLSRGGVSPELDRCLGGLLRSVPLVPRIEDGRAGRDGLAAVARWLVECGADPSATLSDGETPYGIALRRGWHDVIDALLPAEVETWPETLDGDGAAMNILERAALAAQSDPEGRESDEVLGAVFARTIAPAARRAAARVALDLIEAAAATADGCVTWNDPRARAALLLLARREVEPDTQAQERLRGLCFVTVGARRDPLPHSLLSRHMEMPCRVTAGVILRCLREWGFEARSLDGDGRHDLVELSVLNGRTDVIAAILEAPCTQPWRAWPLLEELAMASGLDQAQECLAIVSSWRLRCLVQQLAQGWPAQPEGA